MNQQMKKKLIRQDWSRLGFVSASISCEHCRSSRNHPHCVPRHIIYYYVPQSRKLVFPLQLRVTECCVFRYRGIQCRNWIAHAHYSLTAERNLFLILLLLTSSSYSVSTDYYTIFCARFVQLAQQTTTISTRLDSNVRMKTRIRATVT